MNNDINNILIGESNTYDTNLNNSMYDDTILDWILKRYRVNNDAKTAYGDVKLEWISKKYRLNNVNYSNCNKIVIRKYNGCQVLLFRPVY
mmetsp:Transcript_32640/g.37584  ORF Transcript_32640/g.37584 Transcript_32640/m.37584 type:complete len:90 (+) Transcript_32640:60-329(+)